MQAQELNLEGVPSIGDVVAGKYKIERVLGVGGMGAVLAARHVHLGQKVAIKFLLRSAAAVPEAAARFLREARAVVDIQSEHVARVMDIGTLDDGTPYMVMEHLSGQDLSEVVASRGRLAVHDAVEYVLQACEAIAEAHGRGIVHRDLKPANLFLTSRADGSALVKVLDFGISKAATGAGAPVDGNLTSSRVTMGSPFYMSPEQVRSARTVDHRTDIYALGVILFELLTGAPPFQADSFGGLLAAIVSDAPPRLRDVRPDVPEPLAALVARCLEKEAAGRPPHIGRFAQALAGVASPRARISIERVMRISGEQPVEHADSLPPAPPAPASLRPAVSGTSTGAWGGTHPGHQRDYKAIVAGSLALAVVLAIAVGVVAKSRGRDAALGASPPVQPDTTQPVAMPAQPVVPPRIEAPPAPAVPALEATASSAPTPRNRAGTQPQQQKVAAGALASKLSAAVPPAGASPTASVTPPPPAAAAPAPLPATPAPGRGHAQGTDDRL